MTVPGRQRLRDVPRDIRNFSSLSRTVLRQGSPGSLLALKHSTSQQGLVLSHHHQLHYQQPRPGQELSGPSTARKSEQADRTQHWRSQSLSLKSFVRFNISWTLAWTPCYSNKPVPEYSWMEIGGSGAPESPSGGRIISSIYARHVTPTAWERKTPSI